MANSGDIKKYIVALCLILFAIGSMAENMEGQEQDPVINDEVIPSTEESEDEFPSTTCTYSSYGYYTCGTDFANWNSF